MTHFKSGVNTGSASRGPERQWQISEDFVGQRVDNYLIRELNKVPRSLIYRLLRKGAIKRNGKKIKPNDKLELGDTITVRGLIDGISPKDSNAQALSKRHINNLESSIVYEDKDCLVINKPAGVPVHGGTGQNGGLIEQLKIIRPHAKMLTLVHRLDKGTSGCLLVAKKRTAAKHFHEQMVAHEIQKEYDVLVAGVWPKHLKRLTMPLKKNTLKSGERMVCVDSQGQKALTFIEIYQQNTEFSWLKARLKTGRTHQIRVHCASSDYPVLGDDKYATDNSKSISKQNKINRMCLHSSRLGFNTLAGDWIWVESPLDSQMKLWFNLSA